MASKAKPAKGSRSSRPTATPFDADAGNRSAGEAVGSAAVVGGGAGPTALLSAAFLNMRTVSALSIQHSVRLLSSDHDIYCTAN